MIVLSVCVIGLLSMPKSAADKLRSQALPLSVSVWNACAMGQQILCAGPCNFSQNPSELESLQIENDALKDQIERIFCWLKHQDHLEFLQAEDAKDLIDQTKRYLTGKVIFREPASWSQFIWIDIGTDANKGSLEPILAKNSPVIVNSSLVGVVDECYKKRSLVRLITDENVCPAVRVKRGSIQTRIIKESIDSLLHYLPIQQDIFPNANEYQSFLDKLSWLNSCLTQEREDRFFAKGQLQGLSEPLWRCGDKTLRGFGFQWDRGDEYGPAREITSGQALNADENYSPIELLKVGDVLVTSGLDGVFPPNLKVAVVSKVFPLPRGAPTYELEAKILVPNIHDLTYVHVLPPVLN